jgi:hypothetical protein
MATQNQNTSCLPKYGSMVIREVCALPPHALGKPPVLAPLRHERELLHAHTQPSVEHPLSRTVTVRRISTRLPCIHSTSATTSSSQHSSHSSSLPPHPSHTQLPTLSQARRVAVAAMAGSQQQQIIDTIFSMKRRLLRPDDCTDTFFDLVITNN